jgi:hypothetical protein
MDIIIDYLKDYPLPVLIILQLPLIVLLLYAVKVMYKEIKLEKESQRNLITEHKKELSKLNVSGRKREQDNYDTLKDLIVLLEDIETNQKIIISKLDT